MSEISIIKKWFEAHQEIKYLLSEFAEKHPENTAYALFDKLNTEGYCHANAWFAKGIEKYDNKRLDPIQVFASFNHSTSSDKSRLFKIRNLLKELGSNSELIESETFFDGCPTVMISRVVNTRYEEYQNEIWSFFLQIVQEGRKGLTDSHFEQFKYWYGIDLASFTIFLFWIDPESFLPLDSKTRELLTKHRTVEVLPRSYEDYVSLCERVTDPSVFREIVYYAYLFSQGLSEDKKLTQNAVLFLFAKKEKRDQKMGRILDDDTDSLSHPVRIIGIKPIRKTRKFTKNLTCEIFQFFNNYEFIDGDDQHIKYHENKANYIYLVNGKRVSISAVVGKNASGKSTLTELLFLVLNTLSIRKNVNSDLISSEEVVYVDLYFFTDRFYKLSVGDDLILNKYTYNENEKTFNLREEENLIAKFNLNDFFYSIVINYSLYGLNTKNIGSWIHPLFHKNDSYQTPIVLNPKSTKGNIDVNIEESLAKSRLLAFMLDLNRFETVEIEELRNEDYITERFQVPQLVQDKRPEFLLIKLNEEKLTKYRNYYKKYNIKSSSEEVWQIISVHFGKQESARYYQEEVKEYILYKLISMSETYADKFGKFVKETKKTIAFKGRLESYLDALCEDESHVSFKFWQAVNFLFYDHIKFSRKNEVKLSVLDLAEDIANLIGDESQNRENESSLPTLKPITLIPPAIFETDVLFEGGVSLKSMSSGEKQYVFALNTVAYHIYNLESVDPLGDILSYRYINLLFDEIELYFHPDMQRNFINDLLFYLKQTPWINIQSINMLFITHSPFILSDIPSTNILRLDSGSAYKKPFDDTFAANIHDLLANDFFMNDGFMGEFARRNIKSLISYLTNDKNDKASIGWSIVLAKSVIDQIGEPYLKKDLLDLYYQKLHEDKEVDEINQEIKKLIELKDNLRNSK